MSSLPAPRRESDGRSFDAVVADMYLAVRTARAGDVKGEATAQGHAQQIRVIGWKWGIKVPMSAVGGTASPVGRRQVRHLVVEKLVDSASTSLVAALQNLDKVKKAVLTMCKAGDGQQDFFTITLTDGFVVDIDVVTGSSGNVVEQVTLSFAEMQMEYRTQTGKGALGASSTVTVTA